MMDKIWLFGGSGGVEVFTEISSSADFFVNFAGNVETDTNRVIAFSCGHQENY
jgi:hypothetical protein